VPFSHAPDDYFCNFCRIARLEAFPGLDGIHTTNEHVVLHDDDITAFVASHWWPNNPGHVLVIPNEHWENVYDIPPRLGEPILRATQRLALAMKSAYRCDGISTRQHNEPAGNQDMWHFHQHVFPRFEGDDLYLRHHERALAPDADRTTAAEQLRAALA